jgi:hypothetical protein
LAFGAGDPAYNKLTGTIIRTTLEGIGKGVVCEGGKISHSRIHVAGSNQHSITLLDDNSEITHSELLTNGTGYPIYAANAKKVKAHHNTFNNGEKYPKGYNSNVTLTEGRFSNEVIGAPERIVYANKFAASWFNNPVTVKQEVVGRVPLSATQAVVGTRIILRGEYLIQFASTSGNGSDLALVIAPDETVGGFEGIVIPLGLNDVELLKVNLDLILAAGASGKFDIVSNCTNGAAILSSAAVNGIDSYLNTGAGTLAELGATGTIGIAQDIKIMIHSNSSGALSESNFSLNLMPEIILP